MASTADCQRHQGTFCAMVCGTGRCPGSAGVSPLVAPDPSIRSGAGLRANGHPCQFQCIANLPCAHLFGSGPRSSGDRAPGNCPTGGETKRDNVIAYWSRSGGLSILQVRAGSRWRKASKWMTRTMFRNYSVGNPGPVMTEMFGGRVICLCPPLRSGMPVGGQAHHAP